MRYSNQIIYKRRPRRSIDFRTIPKIKRSRKVQKVLPRHLIFPSCLPNARDSDDLKRFKIFRMKMDIIIKSIEGYLNEYKETKGENIIHIGNSKSKDELIRNLEDDSVKKWFEKLVQLRVFALKELQAFSDNLNVNVDEKIANAKEKLKEFHDEIKKWDSEVGEILERQNLAVLDADNLVLDFQPVDHAIDAATFMNELRDVCDDIVCADDASGEELDKKMERMLEDMGRRQRVVDNNEAKDKKRGDLTGAIGHQFHLSKQNRYQSTRSSASGSQNSPYHNTYRTPTRSQTYYMPSPGSQDFTNNFFDQSLPLPDTSEVYHQTYGYYRRNTDRARHQWYTAQNTGNRSRNSNASRKLKFDDNSQAGDDDVFRELEAPTQNDGSNSNGPSTSNPKAEQEAIRIIPPSESTLRADNIQEFVKGGQWVSPRPPARGLSTLEGRKRKYSSSEYNNKKRRMELIESKIAKYERKIKLIQSQIEKFM